MSDHALSDNPSTRCSPAARCYHCNHEGPLTGPAYSGMCMDREACEARKLAQRELVWREYGFPEAACWICHEFGPVLLNPADPASKPVCVDNVACTQRTHAPVAARA